jgi:epoxyqueuosine reductase
MKILAHACCGPCLIYPAEQLLSQGHDLTTFYYNPNIHPYTEYKQRLDSLAAYCGEVSIPLIIAEYDYPEYFRRVAGHEDQRCAVCYRLRMTRVALEAAQGGFDAFTTSLLVSPYQDHEELKQAGEEAAEAYGVAFHYEDYRPGFGDGRTIAREKGLYNQKYCGCVFSEEERFSKKQL